MNKKINFIMIILNQLLILNIYGFLFSASATILNTTKFSEFLLFSFSYGFFSYIYFKNKLWITNIVMCILIFFDAGSYLIAGNLIYLFICVYFGLFLVIKKYLFINSNNIIKNSNLKFFINIISLLSLSLIYSFMPISFFTSNFVYQFIFLCVFYIYLYIIIKNENKLLKLNYCILLIMGIIIYLFKQENSEYTILMSEYMLLFIFSYALIMSVINFYINNRITKQ